MEQVIHPVFSIFLCVVLFCFYFNFNLVERKSVRRSNVPAGTRKSKTSSSGFCDKAPPLKVDVTSGHRWVFHIYSAK